MCSHVVRREGGQTLLIFVLAMTVLLGFTAMAIDVGMFYEDRRHFQNSADAMALAGVADLPQNPANATLKAQQWGANNGVDPGEIKTIQVRTTGVANDTLFVQLEGDFGWIFGRVLGQTNSKVGAQAAARTGSLVGGHNMMPWGLLQGDTNCLDANGKAIFGATCQVKVGAQNGIGGWRGRPRLRRQRRRRQRVPRQHYRWHGEHAVLHFRRSRARLRQRPDYRRLAHRQQGRPDGPGDRHAIGDAAPSATAMATARMTSTRSSRLPVR